VSEKFPSIALYYKGL